MIKNIVFDLGNVLIKDNLYSVINNLNLTKEDYNIIINSFFTDWKELDLGNITLNEKLDNCNIPEKLKSKYRNYLINYYKYRNINMDLIDLIKQLKENNYNIYILSDNNKEAYNYWKVLPIFKNIDGWIVSCNYKTIKKDKKLYEILFNKYNLNPKECYFIDDKQENINIANSFGMKGHVLNYNKEGINNLLKDMNKNSIKIN